MNQYGIETKTIAGKPVYIFEAHHYALLPWAWIKRNHEDEPLNLMSFDHHTDTHEPFLYHIYYSESRNDEKAERERLLQKIDFRSDSTISQAISKLRNDEHIKTALSCGILNHAYIISPTGKETPVSNEEQERLDNWGTKEAMQQWIEGTYRITPRKERTYPPSQIYIPEFVASMSTEYDSYGLDVENLLLEDMALEDWFLKQQFETFSRMTGAEVSADGIINSRYVLDIDLDYFTTLRAVQPQKHAIFSNLVRGAQAITIARESVCVDVCSDGKVSSDMLLDPLLRLIDTAKS